MMQAHFFKAELRDKAFKLVALDCRRISDSDRERINTFIKRHWFTTTMVIQGKEIDMTKTEDLTWLSF